MVRSIRFAATLFFFVGFAPAALAVATVQTTATGPRASETRISLFDGAGNRVPADSGSPNSFSNLNPGSYTVQVEVGGKPVGGRQSVRLEDGGNQVRVDSETGAVSVLPLLARRQQQQQAARWYFGVDYMRWNDELRICGNVPASTCGDVKMDDFYPSAFVEYRAPLRGTTFGGTTFTPWWYGGLSVPVDSNQEEITLEFHAPTPGLDSGGKRKIEVGVLRGGIGATSRFGGGFMAEANAGLFVTRRQIGVISTEVATRNEFSNTKTVAGLDLGARVGYNLTEQFQAGLGVGVRCYGNQSAGGTSGLGFTYSAERQSGCDTGYGIYGRGRF